MCVLTPLSRKLGAWLGIGLGLALASAALPSPSRACGGFFCSSAPVQQSRERILYAYEADGSLTMAVEIGYAGFDEDFAWIVPVPLPPEISMGTSALFDAVDFATRPMFVLDERTEGTCRVHPRCVREDGSEPRAGRCGGGGYSGSETFVETPEEPPAPLMPPDPGMSGGVTIYSMGPLGPYETVVLGAATAAEVTTWLGEHGYIVPVQTLPLLEPYAALGHVFVALRLSPQRTSEILRPIVLRTPAPIGSETEACLPIRLTAIATAPALPITAFFLGDRLVTPRNFSLAEPALTDPTFFRDPTAYGRAVAAEADRMGGQAFATDYAGRMPLLTVAVSSVADLATVLDPARFMATLMSRGYRGDRLLRDLLDQYLLPPRTVDPTTYYNCLAVSTTARCGRPAGFDPAGLAAAIEREIVGPRAEADRLLRRHTRLTRLSTELSAAEMTLDPVFIRDAGLPDVSNIHRGTLVRRCDGTHYRSDAAVDLEVGGVRTLWSAAAVSDDREYCGRFSAVPSDGVAYGAAAECGYGCNALSVHDVTWAPLLLLALLATQLGRRRP